MLEQVLPSSLYNNNLLEEAISVNELQQQFGSDTLYIAKQDDQVVGYAFMVAKEGYSGQIKLIMGLDDSGTILGVRVISHTETPGLGDKIELAKSDWIKSFNHKSLTNTSRSNWAVKKDGGQFDQFTGATITPRAVVKAIVSGLDFYTNTLATPAATDNVNQPAKQPTKTTETLTLNKGSTRDE